MGNLKSFICGFLLAISSLVLCDSFAKSEKISNDVTAQNKINKLEVPFSDESGFSNNPIEFYKNPINENEIECNLKTQGKVSIVILTTTWCHNCPEVVKELSNCASKIKNSKVIFHNIIVGNDSLSSIREHFDKIGVRNFMLYKSLPMSSIVGLDSIPTCVVFDKNGKQVFRYSGKADYDSKRFRKFLEDLSKR